jgi:hypothetical protein
LATCAWISASGHGRERKRNLSHASGLPPVHNTDDRVLPEARATDYLGLPSLDHVIPWNEEMGNILKLKLRRHDAFMKKELNEMPLTPGAAIQSILSSAIERKNHHQLK